MCLAVISTSHPEYAYIITSNRDEQLSRPTLRADWWKAPHGHVLGGRDLQRSTQGTWLGITKQGRLAILTNFREEGQEIPEGAPSRGEIAKAYLTTAPDSTDPPAKFAEQLVEKEGVKDIGGFSLVFGRLTKAGPAGKREPLGIISNRTPDAKGVIWVAGESGETLGQTCALSNSRYGDRAWPKVVEGEQLLEKAVKESAAARENLEELIERCFEVLSTDRLPARKAGEDMEVYLRQLRNSIFIPAIEGEKSVAAASRGETTGTSAWAYGTQKQTVIVVSGQGKATFVERTLWDEPGKATRHEERDRRYDFHIEGWEK